MKFIKPVKSTLFLFIAMVVSKISFAQEALEAPEIKRPIYEELGVSSTTLFIVMLTFTIFLLFILVALIQSTKNVFHFKRNKTKIGLIVLALGSSFSSHATSVAAEPQGEAFINFPDSAFWAFLTLDIILVMLILYFTGIIKGVLAEFAPKKEKKSLFSRWNKTLTNAVDIEEEDTILLDHDYDGIKELDNDLPPWWKYGFYITIVWGVVYFGVYEVFGLADTQAEEYIAAKEAEDLQIAAYKEANPDMITAENVTLLTDASSLNKGKSIFTTNCVACHMDNGGGGIGPNLTDNAWIYGGDIKGVFNTVSEGATKGMIAWKDLISADEIQAVSSYVLSLPLAEGGKEAEGDNIVERPAK